MNLKQLSYPEHVQFHLTNRCNLNCIFCWKHNYKKRHKDLSDSKLLRLTEEACDLNPKRITISGGGEPLLRYNIVLKMMNSIKKNKIHGVLITNGTIITSNYAKQIINTGWEEVQFSIESPDEVTDDYLRGKKGALKKSIQGIKNINKWKEELKKDTLLCFRTIITKHNYYQLSRLIVFAKNLSINKVYLRTVNEGECDFKGKLSVMKKDYNSFFKELQKTEKLAKSYKIWLELEFNPDDMIKHYKNDVDGRKICKIPYKEMVIFANGKACSCCNFFEYQFTNRYPNALIDTKNNNLKDIWFNGFKIFREEILKNPNDICKICSQDMINHDTKLRN